MKGVEYGGWRSPAPGLANWTKPIAEDPGNGVPAIRTNALSALGALRQSAIQTMVAAAYHHARVKGCLCVGSLAFSSISGTMTVVALLGFGIAAGVKVDVAWGLVPCLILSVLTMAVITLFVV